MPKLLIAGSLALLLVSPGLALTPAERLAGGQSPGENPDPADTDYYLDGGGELAPSSEGDEDLGTQVILRRESGRAPIRASLDTYLFWSNNVGNTEKDEDEGWFFGGSISAGWKQRLGGSNWFFDSYAYQDAFWYDSDDLDFQSTEFGAGFTHTNPDWGNLTLYGRYEFLYIRADNPFFGPLDGDEHEYSRFHRLRFGAYKAIYEQPNFVVTASGNVRWDFDANSGSQRRFQYSGRLASTWRVVDQLRATAYYRLSYRSYLSSSREDWNHYLGVELTYPLNSWSQVYASALYGNNDSNKTGRDYEGFQAGLGLGFRASF